MCDATHRREPMQMGEEEFEQTAISAARLVKLQGGAQVAGRAQPNLAVGIGDSVALFALGERYVVNVEQWCC